MPRPTRFGLFGLLVLALTASAPAMAADQYLGGGVRFFRTLNDVKVTDIGKIDTDGNSLIASYLIDPAGLLKFEIDLEYFDSGYGDQTGAIVSPQALALVGGKLYGGVGAGINYVQDNQLGDNTSGVFYIGRVGLDLTLLPRVRLDLNANYQTDVFDNIFDGASSDSITLGAIVRFRIK
jgi:hypothetical protein